MNLELLPTGPTGPCAVRTSHNLLLPSSIFPARFFNLLGAVTCYFRHHLYKFLGNVRPLILSALGVWTTTITTYSQSPSEVALPAGVRAVWDLEKAYRETASTRERICLNG